MQKFLVLLAAGVLSIGLEQGSAFAQTQPNGRSASAASNSSAVPKAQLPGGGTVAPSNQDLPGNANPGNATGRDARANGQEIRPNGTNSAPSGTAGSGKDSSTSNPTRDDTSTSPARGGQLNNPVGHVQWFWVTLGVVMVVLLIAALLGRSPAGYDRVEHEKNIRPDLRSSRGRRETDYDNDQIRKAG